MRYFVSMLLIAGIFTTSAQQWKFSHINSDNGLSTGTVNCVFRDSKGYLWIGTIDGLNRYNGYEIEVFKTENGNPNSISGNVITSIDEDASGRIWIATRNSGVSVFDWNTADFTQILPGGQEGLPEESIQKLTVANENNVLIGLLGGGLCRYDFITEKVTIYRTNPRDPSSLTNNNVFSIIKASEDEFWIGNHHGGVDLFNINNESFRRFTYDPSINPNTPMRQSLLIDRSGNLWIGTDGDGVVKYNTQRGDYDHYVQSTGGLNSNIIKTLHEDENGLIYIGTDGGGINVHDPSTGNFSYLKSDLYDVESLSSNAIYEIYQDNEGIVWISTFRGGINYYSKYRYKFHLYEHSPSDENSLSFSSVIALAEASDGAIWVGTDGGGLDRIDPETGRFQHFINSSSPASLSSNVAISVLEDNEGYLWVGTYAGGLNRFDPRTNRFQRFQPNPKDPTALRSRNVWAIVEDHENELWFGLLDAGLAHYNKSTGGFDHYQANGGQDDLSSNLVVSLVEDSKRNLWVGTEDAGLNLFNKENGTFKNYSNDPENMNSLLNNNVRTMYQGSGTTLWIGTAEGMNELDINTLELKASPVNVLLPNLVINGILEDTNKNIWISTNQGLSRYNPESHEIQNFTTADGLQGNEFNYTASMKASNGRMYFGGTRGLNDFHPNEVQLSPFKPDMVLSAIKLFDRSIYEFNEEGMTLADKTLPFIEEINLSHDQNVLTLEFSSMDFASPAFNQYRYQLVGFDQNWIYADASKRAATYTNLDPDEYTFQVQGTNSDGVWSGKTRILTINVSPPWWATWWFRFLVASFIVTVAFFVSRWRIRMIKSQREELEKRVEEATAQVMSQNDELKEQQEYLKGAIEDTNYVISEAVESGNFSARIDTESKSGEWKDLGDLINRLFDTIQVPFTAINRLSGAMANSDLSQRFEGDARGDVKLITDNLNHALGNLAELLFEITSQTLTIGNATEDMMVSSEEMKVSTREISSSIGEMSNGAQSQVHRIDEASSILEKILEFSLSVENQAETINGAAKKGVSLSDKGKDLIATMEENMKKMLHVSKETNQSIDILSDKSREITRVLNIIKDIAVQTNMLALNAAIEAAKAGDAGRGFSVVAEQIRKLAEDSGKSTEDIGHMVDAIQKSIGNTTQLIFDMNNDIQEGVTASADASKSFEEIAVSYSQTLEMSEQIVEGTKEQNESVKKVVELMEGVVVIAEQTAAGTEEIASSANELSSGMNEYSERSTGVADIVKQLKEKVDQFKLENQELSENQINS